MTPAPSGEMIPQNRMDHMSPMQLEMLARAENDVSCFFLLCPCFVADYIVQHDTDGLTRHVESQLGPTFPREPDCFCSATFANEESLGTTPGAATSIPTTTRCVATTAERARSHCCSSRRCLCACTYIDRQFSVWSSAEPVSAILQPWLQWSCVGWIYQYPFARVLLPLDLARHGQ